VADEIDPPPTKAAAADRWRTAGITCGAVPHNVY
jgi:hypothetical protein